MSSCRSPCACSAGLLLRLVVSGLPVDDRDISAGKNTSPFAECVTGAWPDHLLGCCCRCRVDSLDLMSVMERGIMGNVGLWRLKGKSHNKTQQLFTSAQPSLC